MKRTKISMAIGAIALGLASFVATHASTLRFAGVYYWFKVTPTVVYDGHYTLTATEGSSTGCIGASTRAKCRFGYTLNQINFPAVTLKSGAIARTIIYTRP